MGPPPTEAVVRGRASMAGEAPGGGVRYPRERLAGAAERVGLPLAARSADGRFRSWFVSESPIGIPGLVVSP